MLSAFPDISDYATGSAVADYVFETIGGLFARSSLSKAEAHATLQRIAYRRSIMHSTV